MECCIGPKAGCSIYTALLHLAARGLVSSIRGKLNSSTSPCTKGEGCFCFKAAGKLVSLCLGLPVLLPCYSSISSERLTSPLLPPAHFHGSRSRRGRPRPNSTAWMSHREGNGRVWEQGRAGARMEPVTRTGCT